MKKRIVSFQSIEIPFKAKFAHHTAIRESTETIIVEIKNENGLIGFGEACPRSYVTGETVVSVSVFLEQVTPDIIAIKSLEDLKILQISLKNEIDKNPSAWCALEMAMLDLLAREKKISIEELLNISTQQNRAPYTAVQGIDSFLKVLIKFLIYKFFGFSDFKFKLSGNQQEDLKVLKLLKLSSKSIRVDANNLFKTADETIAYLTPLRTYIWAIEEPVAPNDFHGMQKIAETLKLKIILDESFLNQSSIEPIKGMKDLYIPNLRISKLGGILRTLTLIEQLESLGIDWILGSHVGEMSLLTRASLLISGSHHKHLKAIEGGFSTHLLSYDPFFPNLKLGMGATINWKKYSLAKKPGLGMDYKRKE